MKVFIIACTPLLFSFGLAAPSSLRNSPDKPKIGYRLLGKSSTSKSKSTHDSYSSKNQHLSSSQRTSTLKQLKIKTTQSLDKSSTSKFKSNHDSYSSKNQYSSSSLRTSTFNSKQPKSKRSQSLKPSEQDRFAPSLSPTLFHRSTASPHNRYKPEINAESDQSISNGNEFTTTTELALADSSTFLAEDESIIGVDNVLAQGITVEYHVELFDIVSAMNSTISNMFESLAQDFVIQFIPTSQDFHFSVKTVTIISQHLRSAKRRLLVNMTISADVYGSSEDLESASLADLVLYGFEYYPDEFIKRLRTASEFFISWQSHHSDDLSFGIANVQMTDIQNEDSDNKPSPHRPDATVAIPLFFIGFIAVVIIFVFVAVINRRGYYNMNDGPKSSLTTEPIEQISSDRSYDLSSILPIEDAMLHTMTVENDEAISEVKRMDDDRRLEHDLEAIKMDVDNDIYDLSNSIEILSCARD